MMALLVNSHWLLTPQRVALHLPTATAVVADLHLGYDHARRNGGDAIPAMSLEEQLGPLRQVLLEQTVRHLVIAGDLVESVRCQAFIPAFQTWIDEQKLEWSGLVPGNHDRGAVPGGLPLYPQGKNLGGWTVVHGDSVLPAGRVVHGHIHPHFRWTNHAAGVCYLVRPERLVLPAYSVDSAGLNVRGDRQWEDFRCCVIAGPRVLDLGLLRNLRGRAAERPGGQRFARRPPGRRS